MNNKSQVIASTNHLRLVDQDGWSHVERTKASGVVCIAGCTNENKILLVEQFRPPVQCNVIELPAGLGGDEVEYANESLENAARRELLEETGYETKHLRLVAELASSAGLTNEVVSLFIATELEKLGPGGGDDSEEITVHEIAIEYADQWLVRAQVDGKLVDGRVFAGLHFLNNESSFPDLSSLRNRDR